MLIMIGLNIKFFVLVSLVVGALVAVVVAGPIHASCHINWTFGEQCSAVESALVAQIHKWEGADGCDNGGEKCRYALVSATPSMLKATHTTPKKHYVDDLSFKFTPASAKLCNVEGYSTSETWYAVLDSGTNYCNLRNLIDGAGLDKVAGFGEDTSDAVCTQYSSHNCTVY